MFLMVDGIDGSGKGTIVRALAERIRNRGARMLDLREVARTEHRLPEPAELDGVEVLISCEPTYSWMGAALREEIVRDNGRDYGALRTAEVFALDRLLLYRRVLLPARAAGINIIQERGVISSLVYQPIQEEPVTIEDLVALPGNALALAHPPDLCLLLSVEPTRAVQRLALRAEKRDVAVFEKLPILERLHARYHAPWLTDLLAPHGWRCERIDVNGAVEDAVEQAYARCAALTDAFAPVPVR